MKIHKDAQIGTNVSFGNNTIIGKNVCIGDDSIIGDNVVIVGRTKIGRKVRVYTGAVIGTDPQDLKYNGEDTAVSIGDNCIIREYVTFNKGTEARGETTMGNGSMLMAYVHIAHDCIIGNDVIIANSTNLSGHVHIEDSSVIGGINAIHQFVRIGAYAMIGGASRISKDVAPYTMAAGSPLKTYGLNNIGLRRRGFKEIRPLKRAYNILFSKGMNFSQALLEVETNCEITKEVRYLIDFIKASKRGVTRT